MGSELAQRPARPWVVEFVRDVGFPIAVAAFVLLRLEARVEDLVDQTRRSNELLTRVVAELRVDGGRGDE